MMRENDKSSFTGLILIAAIFILGNLFLFNQGEQDMNPSLEIIEDNNTTQEDIEEEISEGKNTVTESAEVIDEEKILHLENDRIKLTFSNKNAQIISARLLDYKTYQEYHVGDSLSKLNISYEEEALEIFNSESSEFMIIGEDGVSTNAYFEITESNDTEISFRKNFSPNTYIEYIYSLDADDENLVNLTINPQGIKNPELTWTIAAPITEKSKENQKEYTGFYYQEKDDKDVDYTWDNDRFEINEFKVDLQWVAFKQQFFSTIIHAKDHFSRDTEFKVSNDEDSKYIKKLSMRTIIDSEEKSSYSIYLGPNDYNKLKEYNQGYEKIIPLGWGIFGWVNKYIVINIFNLLTQNAGLSNFGLIILILTLIIKLALSPLTYKSYLSQAKMKVLKPEIDKINEKNKGKDPMKVQQETMGLYRKAGVNPLGGCLPMLVQFPILIAMFRFFPVSLELRQNSFLWADDLSAYDSIYDLGFYIPMYGDHISLFTLLMTISTLIYTHMNNQMTSTQMPGMKFMMYLMPFMFLGFLNNYASSLSYYYFLANVFTFSQMFLMRKFVDDDAILSQLEENKKKPPKPKSRFQKKLEEMQKKQEQQLKKRKGR